MKRYLILKGYNTKQLWVYDEIEDIYIDPPIEVLDLSEEELDEVVNNDKPSWLYNGYYQYKDIEI